MALIVACMHICLMPARIASTFHAVDSSSSVRAKDTDKRLLTWTQAHAFHLEYGQTSTQKAPIAERLCVRIVPLDFAQLTAKRTYS